MAAIYEEPFPIYAGAEAEFVCTCAVAGGGTGRAFVFRVGRKGAPALIQKTMDESESTGTSVTLSTTLTPEETASLKTTEVDFQIVCDDPLDVFTEGTLRVKPMIGPLRT